MGYGFPAALGAQLAFPDRQVVAIVGDGGFQMTMSELASAPATFIATGITGGLLDAPRRTARGMVTDSLLVARGAVMRLQHTTPIQE